MIFYNELKKNNEYGIKTKHNILYISKNTFEKIQETTPDVTVIGSFELRKEKKAKNLDKNYFVNKNSYYLINLPFNYDKDILGYVYVGDNNYLQIANSKTKLVFFALLFAMILIMAFVYLLKTHNNPISSETEETTTLLIETQKPIIISDNETTNNEDRVTIQGYSPQVIDENNQSIILYNPDKYHYITFTVTDTFDGTILLSTGLISPSPQTAVNLKDFSAYEWNAYEQLKNEGVINANIHIVAYTLDKEKCHIEYDVDMRIKTIQ